MGTGRPGAEGEKDQGGGERRVIELRDDQLIFRFPEVHEDAEFRLEFQRTL